MRIRDTICKGFKVQRERGRGKEVNIAHSRRKDTTSVKTYSFYSPLSSFHTSSPLLLLLSHLSLPSPFSLLPLPTSSLLPPLPALLFTPVPIVPCRQCGPPPGASTTSPYPSPCTKERTSIRHELLLLQPREKAMRLSIRNDKGGERSSREAGQENIALPTLETHQNGALTCVFSDTRLIWARCRTHEQRFFSNEQENPFLMYQMYQMYQMQVIVLLSR